MHNLTTLSTLGIHSLGKQYEQAHVKSKYL